MPKIYEKQLYDHFDSILLPKQCVFRKDQKAQYCLMVILEKLKGSRDKGDNFGALFIDLSKAFDCIDHNLLITKQIACVGVTTKSVDVTKIVRIDNSYSNTHEIMYCVPQGLVL